jgi:hypothetical protein
VRLVKVVNERPEATLVPPGSLKFDLEAVANAPTPRKSAPVGKGKSSTVGKGGAAGSSWWTSRATAGTVTSGFTKEEVLRRPEADPRAPGGMFSRLEELLRA